MSLMAQQLQKCALACWDQTLETNREALIKLVSHIQSPCVRVIDMLFSSSSSSPVRKLLYKASLFFIITSTLLLHSYDLHTYMWEAFITSHQLINELCRHLHCQNHTHSFLFLDSGAHKKETPSPTAALPQHFHSDFHQASSINSALTLLLFGSTFMSHFFLLQHSYLLPLILLFGFNLVISLHYSFMSFDWLSFFFRFLLLPPKPLPLFSLPQCVFPWHLLLSEHSSASFPKPSPSHFIVAFNTTPVPPST